MDGGKVWAIINYKGQPYYLGSKLHCIELFLLRGFNPTRWFIESL